jgi:uncharacterized membrane protein YphA (DoxX/SURF4 family)
VKAAWRRLVAFVDEREDPAALAVCRILIGVAVFTHVVNTLATGAASIAWVRVADGGVVVDERWLAPIGATYAHVVAVAVVCCAAAVCFALGLFTRPSLFVLWLTYRALTGLNREYAGGYDPLIIDILVPLFFSGCGAALSVDALRRRRRGLAAADTARWPRVVLVCQLAFLYGGTALMKASAGWVPGGSATALWLFLHSPTWTRFAVDALPSWLFPLTQVATTTTWLFEISTPLVVIAVLVAERAPHTRRARRVRMLRNAWIAYAVALHIGIEALMEVGPFLLSTCALFACAFRPDEWRAFFTRATAALRAVGRRSAGDRSRAST